MIKRKIIKNSIQCNICGDIIESRFRHHYVECSCGACFVDGGHAYQRIGYTEEGCYTDLSIIKEVNYIQERYKTYPKAQSKTSDKNSEFKNTEHKS